MSLAIVVMYSSTYKVFCFTCLKAVHAKLTILCNRGDAAFSKKSFENEKMLSLSLDNMKIVHVMENDTTNCQLEAIQM